ncbi:SLC13 family permease [Taylorella asinigenitalis]|uniref:Membrane protein n=1 Tax=Taylorella asinigenitalis (strain MCE3) TaxID=1008459 RepID=G4QDI9_TAYAM|nr:SLC13 family permease [Taylorella asinigenitalis]AEP36006.1 membrane protein [Taylorella asinigenitalis MCE3]
MISALIIAAIVVSIAIGYIFKINIGLLAISFAYIIGTFILDLKPSQIVALWPLKLFFVIMAVSLFYNFATVNGTLEKLADNLIYRSKNYPYLLTFAVFVASTLIAAMGAGFYSVLAFMAPLTLFLCDKTGMSRIAGAMAINYGALGGANFMTSQSGVIFRGLIEGTGRYDAAQAFSFSTVIFIATIIVPIIVLSGFVFSNKRSGRISLDSDMPKPEPMNSKQQITVILIGLLLVIVLAGPILRIAFPESESIAYFNSRIDIGFLAAIFTVISLFLKLADEKKVIALVPWSTLILIGGVGLLIGVAVKAGTIDLLAHSISTGVPKAVLPVALCLIAAFMSVFSSTLGVVTPTLFPIVPALAQAAGLSPALLFASIVVGSQSTAISPFSSGGSLIMGACKSDEERDNMLKGLLFRAIPIGLAMAVLATVFMHYIIY